MLDLSYIDVEDLLKSTEIKNISVSGGEATYSCFGEKHMHGDHNPSARMNLRTTAFICHGCGMRGNAISFLALHKKMPETVAKRLLEERYGGGLSAPIDDLMSEVERIMGDTETVEETRRLPHFGWISRFQTEWYNANLPAPMYMYERGFRATTCEEWELGFDEYSQRITIPIRDHEGQLVGFKGRAIEDDTPFPRYMILGDTRNQQHYDFDPYHKSEIVFGLNRFRLRNDKFPSSTVIIVEGELNVISMDQKGFPNTVGVAGSEFSETQRELIYKYCDSAIVYFDDDEAGRKGTRKVIEMLAPCMHVRAVVNPLGDAADLSRESIQELIANADPALLLYARGDL